MAPLPYTDSGAKIAFFVLFGVFVVLEWRVRVHSLLNRGAPPSDRGSRQLVYLSVVGALLGAFALARDVHGAAFPAGRWPLFIVGLILMATGILLRQWAVTILGRFFTTDVRVAADQVVVERGPYRWVRHPSYSGMLLTFAGIGLALGNGAALGLLLVLPTAGLVVRIRVEERALLNGLGEPYRRFAESRARLIPGLW